MDLLRPTEWGTRFHFPENMKLPGPEDGNFVTQRLVVTMAEHYDASVVEAIAEEARKSGVEDLTVLNKEGIVKALMKQTPMPVRILDGCSHWCPRCGRPLHRPTGIGNEHYCIFCGQLVTWRRD